MWYRTNTDAMHSTIATRPSAAPIACSAIAPDHVGAGQTSAGGCVFTSESDGESSAHPSVLTAAAATARKATGRHLRLGTFPSGQSNSTSEGSNQ